MERAPRSGRGGTVRRSSSARSAGGNFVAMAATRTGIGQRDETGWGEEEDVVTTAAAMLSREGAVHDAPPPDTVDVVIVVIAASPLPPSDRRHRTAAVTIAVAEPRRSY